MRVAIDRLGGASSAPGSFLADRLAHAMVGARVLAVALGASGLMGCGQAGERPPPREAPYETAAATAQPAPRAEVQEGNATWYGQALAGHHTASGERFDPSKMTAAHRTLPLGTWVEVVRVDTGQSVRVRVNDRGPFGHADRIIDLSRAAAKELGFVKTGVAHVRIHVVQGP